jgi:Fe-Mn family superoxide dismutase
MKGNPLNSNLDRRSFIGKSSAIVAAAAFTGNVIAQDDAGFVLPKLPYAYDALEPFIDAKTVEIHYDKHHRTYVSNLNKLLAGNKDLMKMDINQLVSNISKVPEAIRQGVTNNAGGNANHILYWDVMGPKAGGNPTGAIAKVIDQSFESFDKLKEKVNQAGLTRFGSGWSWLVVDATKKLQVISTANQDSPLMTGNTPILGIDVWEHAYYLKYQNKRADYLAAWWNLVNWKAVSDRFGAAISKS